ncbi:MAG: 4-alpha-glucanotransferase [Polyangiaceae bacterium]
MLGEDGARLLAEAQARPAVDYPIVRALKRKALRAGFERFRRDEQWRSSARGRSLLSFQEENRGWLQDYALFRALREANGDAKWAHWLEPLRRREAGALAEAAEVHKDEVFYHVYVQWLAHTQWYEARARCGSSAWS